MHRLLRRPGLSRLFALCIVAAFVGVATPARAELTRQEYEACQSNDEAAFRTAIEQITVSALKRELQRINYGDHVQRQWLRLELDQLINTRVDAAVRDVRNETSWGSLIASLASQEQAEKLATAVAERVYQSDEMRKAIEDLAAAVGEQVGNQIALSEAETTEPALACLKAFVGPRYGDMIASAAISDAGAGLDVEAASDAASSVGSGSLMKESGAGITGAAILVMRRQLGRMAGRLGQRLAGAVLARLVSVVAGGVGVVLIAKDVWDLRHGVLPIIAEEMKSEDSKQKVRQEIASTLSDHIKDHGEKIGAETAKQIVEVWHSFRRAHARALDLAERNETFRSLLEDLTPAQLPRLDEIVALLLTDGGEPAILTRVKDGTLEQAIKSLPESGMTIARETGSVGEALAWSAVAGDDLDKVLEHDLHRHTKAEAFTQTTLQRLVALDDRLTISRLAKLPADPRERLFELPADDLKKLARGLTAAELDLLASYLTGLGPEPQKTVLTAIVEDPSRLQILNSRAVRNAVVSSRDQAAALAMLLRRDGETFSTLKADVELAWSGRITPQLIVTKHPLASALSIIALILIALIGFRLLWPQGRTRAEQPKA